MCILSFTQRFPSCWILKVFMLLFHKYHCSGQYHGGLCVYMLWTTSPRHLRACCGFTACLSPPLEYEINLVTCISQTGHGRSDVCDFGDWVIKGLRLLPFFFLGHVFWIRQLTCYKDAQAVLWRGSWGDQPPTWQVSHLGSKSLSLRQIFRWMLP